MAGHTARLYRIETLIRAKGCVSFQVLLDELENGINQEIVETLVDTLLADVAHGVYACTRYSSEPEGDAR